MGLEDAEDLATSDGLDERDTVLVTELDTDLRRHLTLLRRLRDQLLHLRAKSTSHQPTAVMQKEKAAQTPSEARRHYSHRRRLS